GTAGRWWFCGGPGSGGKGVNSRGSRVELVVDLSCLTGADADVGRARRSLGDSLRIVVTTERSQLRNREIALERLAKRLDEAARPRRARTPTRRTAASVRRRLDAKRRRAQLKAKRRDPGDDG